MTRPETSGPREALDPYLRLLADLDRLWAAQRIAEILAAECARREAVPPPPHAREATP